MRNSVTTLDGATGRHRRWLPSAAIVVGLVLASTALWQWFVASHRFAADTAPADIRGEPITAASASLKAASPAVAPAAVVAAPVSTTALATPQIPAAQPAPLVATAPPPADAGAGDYLAVGFDKLASFTFVMPDEPAPANRAPAPAPPTDQNPETVRALDKKRVALKGFMLPLKVEGGKVTEMLLLKDQSMCCFGTVPKITEWVTVKMVAQGVKPIMDQTVTLYGKLHVGEIRENGYLVGIYQMDGEKMAGPRDL